MPCETVKHTHPEILYAVIDADTKEITRNYQGLLDLYTDITSASIMSEAYNHGPGRNAGYYVAQVTLTWEKTYTNA